MKAKVIKTGEIINVIPMDGGWAANFTNGARHFEDSELDFSFEDWEKFHREAAKDILCALLGRVERFYTGVSIDGRNKISDHKDFIKLAINIVDELIKQLKEGRK